jgi:predicted RNase H-like HicB family nuclease
MRFEGRVFKVGRHWAIEVPILRVVTQGRSKREAFEMIADAIEALVDQRGFEAIVFPGSGEYFEVGATGEAPLTALLLRRERQRAGLTLAQAAERLGSKSANAYARYEQGRAIPTVVKLSQLLAAVAPKGDFVLVESRT